MPRNGWLFFISQKRSKTMIFSDSPQQRALERMMTAVPRFLPQGGGTMVRHYFAYTAEMCDCRYCLYYCRKCTADSCPCIEERILAGAAGRSEVMSETMKDIHNAAFRRRLNQFIRESEELSDICLRTRKCLCRTAPAQHTRKPKLECGYGSDPSPPSYQPDHSESSGR